MLENLVAWVLNNYIGEYLENLNTDQLSIAILQGQVELENVPFKKTALRKFDIPVQVKSGLLGKLTLSIPLTRIRSEPWVLKMSDLLILLESATCSRHDVENMELYEQTKKDQQLEELEKYHKRQLLSSIGLAFHEEMAQETWWGASLFSTVLNNIQVILTNVHIRYEDSVTLPNGIPFCCGIRIHNVSVQTTDPQWKVEYIQPREGVNAFKKLELKGLSVYWNCNQQTNDSFLSSKELQDALAPETGKGDTYILQPFSARLFLEKNTSKFPLKTMPPVPRFKFDFRPQKVVIELSVTQIAQMHFLAMEWARHERARKHRKWRPQANVIECPKDWWIFAYNRVLDETRQRNSRRTWQFATSRAKHLNSYCRSYRRKLLSYLEKGLEKKAKADGKGVRANQNNHDFTLSASQRNIVALVSERNKRSSDVVGLSPHIQEPHSITEDLILMKQIERDSECSYNELQLFRETVFRRLLNEVEVEKQMNESGVQSEDEVFEQLEIPLERKLGEFDTHTVTPEAGSSTDIGPSHSSNYGGIYGWFSSWWSSTSETQDEDNSQRKEENVLELFPDDSTYLKRLEKQLEDEILGALNESWDDSTILRRDALLAEIALRLDHMTVRFIDNKNLYVNGSSRVLAMDLRRVIGCVQLSLRQNSTAVSLTVGDMTVQRLYTASNDFPINRTASSTDCSSPIDGSLIFGGSDDADSAHILFAIGKASGDTFENLSSNDKAQGKLFAKPLFRMTYCRHAPKLVAKHTIDADFSELTVMYDEGAFDDITNFFDANSVSFEGDESSSVAVIQPSEVYLTVHIPQVRCELRSKRNGLLGSERSSGVGTPFAHATVSMLTVRAVKNQNHLLKVGISFNDFSLEDMFERTGGTLVRTMSHRALSQKKSLSCPSIHSTFATIDPLARATSMENVAQGNLYSLFDTELRSTRLTDTFNISSSTVPRHAVDNNISKSSIHGDHSSIELTFMNSEHKLFEKAHCIVDAQLLGLSIGMNRRSWIMLFDFFGLLGRKNEELLHEKPSNGQLTVTEDVGIKINNKSSRKGFIGLRLSVSLPTFRINMNYPANKTQLGVLTAQNVSLTAEMVLGNDHEPLSLDLSCQALALTDSTHLYSRLYSERLSLQPDVKARKNKSNFSSEGDLSHSGFHFHLEKFFPPDPELKRPWDMKIILRIPPDMALAYVHTQRYICILIEFWLQFFELQDQVIKSNMDPSDVILPKHGLRAQLDVVIGCSSALILPLNQFSEQVIICSLDSLHITNNFLFFDAVKSFQDHFIGCYDEDCIDVNCLIDWITVKLNAVSIFQGLRVANQISAIPDFPESTVISQSLFDTYYFLRASNSVLSRPYDLLVDVYRNLDGLFSHKAPDMAVITSLSDMGIDFTTDFYRLLRGFLEKNLGDQLVPIPETIPLEILQKPISSCEVGMSLKYATFSFRLDFKKVELKFLVPCEESALNFQPFALAKLEQAHISFDVYIDNQSELDFVCENSELWDIRLGRASNIVTPNIYSLIGSPRMDANKKREDLMLEAHLMLKKDEPPVVTLVLCKARVLIIYEWLDNFKDFVLLNSDFTPPVDDSCTVIRTSDSIAKSGVMHRVLQFADSMEATEQTMTLKITLQQTDLVILENPSMEESFALVARTSAVFNFSDPHGKLSANLELQSLMIAWCLMSAEWESWCELTNNFSVTLILTTEPESSHDDNIFSVSPGLPVFHIPKHKVMCDINNFIARISYRDTLVIKKVLEEFKERFRESSRISLIPKTNYPDKGNHALNIVRYVFKSDHIAIWFLDDFQGNAFPLLRLVLTKVELKQYIEKLNGSLVFGVDYFNQRVFGWEPLIEPWHVQHLSVYVKNHCLTADLYAEELSTLDVNVTQVFLQQAVQFNSQWQEMKSFFETDFRKICSRSRSDHLPYLLENKTGSDLRFATAVEEVLMARNTQRRSNAKWHTVPAGAIYTFEFPTKQLVAMGFPDEPRQLIIRVDGWDEISPVNVDSVGTCFRLARSKHILPASARLVIEINMNRDGKKVVTVRSALTIVNRLPDTLLINLDNNNRSPFDGYEILRLGPGSTLSVPLKLSSARIFVKPDGRDAIRALPVDWPEVMNPGEIVTKTLHFETKQWSTSYWVCALVKREHYPEYETLPGHTITLSPPLSLLNLLPVDAEVISSRSVYAVGAGKQLDITTIDITGEIKFNVRTDRFHSAEEILISRAVLNQKSGFLEPQRLDIKMVDVSGSLLDMYGSVNVARSGAVILSLWVPYWIVNKSGIPLILRQEAADNIAAGQHEEHERAKDRNPLMFSFADINCPNRCSIRVGNQYLRNKGYTPSFSERFSLTPGVQSLKLLLTHEQKPTLIYNIGVEVRQGTGRYKDTQVVLLTPRYQINNQSSFELLLSHVDDINNTSQHVKIASNCNFTWNEKFEDKQMLCVKRIDVKYWSCPFPIDKIGSFHITMRDLDDTPHFVRAEIILCSAVFCVTFTDAKYFPPPIQLVNVSDVPVLYHQKTKRPETNHLRTICKANSVVDYAWDDPYGEKLLILQVFENKSNTYDPQKPGLGAPLIYDNDVYIRFAQSFTRRSGTAFTDEYELVLEVMQKGKVMLNKLNLSDSSRSQLWRFAKDGCLENIGMSHRAKRGERYVLDVLDRGGNKLMMLKRNTARDQYQKWTYTSERRLRCGVTGMYVEGRATEVVLAEPKKYAKLSSEGVPMEQIWELKAQRPGSGTLDVECLHKGPTLVVRISDRAKQDVHLTLRRTLHTPESLKESSMHAKEKTWAFEVNVSLRNGLGISLINGQREELIYSRFQGIALHANRFGNTFQVTASVEVIQADNQLLFTDRWQVLYCQENALSGDPTPVDRYVVRPALKLEMNCTPLEHYVSFDCFRLKLCDMSAQLDEALLWKLVQFVQESGAADSVQPSALLRPPNIELERPDPTKARRCHFGTLDLEMGDVALSVVTIAKSGLTPDLRKLRQQFNIKLVSFENAMISLPPFRQFRYFETLSFLIETLRKFYMEVLKSQTFNIIVTMDAFGNPSGLASDLKESFEGLVFEGDLSAFVGGLGYGITNSISKVASSMAHGVGTLTFDEQHELMRRRMLRCQPQSDNSSALSHLYSGVKGLGVGVFGGLTAIVTNTIKESKRDGFTGAIRGITTGAVDTVTKPVQGIFDLVEGTASAMKEIVGGPSARKSHFSKGRVRLPRVCSNLQSLLPSYSEEYAAAQMALLRIKGFSSSEVLLDLENLLDQRSADGRMCQHALICSEQCYIVRQTDSEPSSVTQRIPYKYLRHIYPLPVEHSSSFASIEITLEYVDGKRQALPHLWCNRTETAKRLCEKILRAKQLYEDAKRTLSVVED